MARDKILTLVLIHLLLFWLQNPNVESQVVRIPPFTPRSLCVSQFKLVNYACAKVPFTPDPPNPPLPPLPPAPVPPSPDLPDDDHHKHRHHHHHHHRHHGNPQQEECCRWLTSVERECVCDLLVHLPHFLSRPAHQYTVIVDESCSVTYECGSRITP